MWLSKNRYTGILVVFFALFLMVSCTGQGEGGKNASGIGLSSLILPEKVSVVDPKATTSGKPLAAGKLLLSGLTGTDLSSITPPTDYQADKVTVYVNERSLEAFDTVNDILCTIRQTRYDAMINQGPYKAQVDKNLCSSDRSNASSAGQASSSQSSGATMPQFEIDTIVSSRASEQSPQIIQVWAHPQLKSGETVTQVIYGKAVITEGADTAPPYGIFKINFKSLDANDLSTVLFKGLLNAERDPATGKVLLYFSIEDKDSYIIQKATLDKKPDGTTGAGSVLNVISLPSMTPSATRFNLAYNQNNFLRTDNAGAQICLKRTTYEESAWKYGLYTAQTPTGTRVNLNAGFPVRKGGDYGWIGYWGAWFPNGTTLSNGDPVFKHDYATNTDTAYTVLKSGGRLKKYTRNNTTLGGINNVPLIWWDSSTGTTITYLIAWDSATQKFYQVAKLDANGAWQTIATPTVLSLSALSWVDILAWSQAMNGLVIIKFPPPTNLVNSTPTSTNCGYTQASGRYDCSSPAANDTVPVIFYKEDVMFPIDPVPSTLACFDNCPDVVSLATATPYRTDILSYQSGTAPSLATYASYSFDTSSMTLLDTRTTPTAVYLTVPNPAYSGGISSGPLFEPTLANLNSLACDWSASQTCGGKAWTVLPAFYVWETGSNSWNQFTTIKDGSGTAVKFDPPLQVRYTHYEAGSPYDGRTFYFQYNGFGDLQGIPGMCVNIDTGAKNVDCSLAATDPAIRWVPEFNIPDIQPVGSPSVGDLTEVTDIGTGKAYIVKTLEKEQRMSSALVSACTGSGLSTTAYILPSMSSWLDPALGPEPVITDAPAVIGGVVQ